MVRIKEKLESWIQIGVIKISTKITISQQLNILRKNEKVELFSCLLWITIYKNSKYLLPCSNYFGKHSFFFKY